jgi:hypothetical protein
VAGLNYVGFIKLDNETIGYNEISGNTLQNCVRGVDGSTAAAHTAGAIVTVRNLPNINVWPAKTGKRLPCGCLHGSIFIKE